LGKEETGVKQEKVKLISLTIVTLTRTLKCLLHKLNKGYILPGWSKLYS